MIPSGLSLFRLASKRRIGLGLCSVLISVLAIARLALSADVTFLVTSDSHYDALENEDRNQRNRETLQEMNRISAVRWPVELGGDSIARPRGVLVLGDVIDDGDRLLEGRNQGALQWECFLADFGLDGTDGLLKYPVFEGWGNHDGPPPGRQRHGFSMQSELKRRNQLRKQKGLIRNVSDNGLHYSWDWDGVLFVQLNLYPADKPHPDVKYSPVHHDPQGALRFLQKTLQDHVGRSGRPVVIAHHYDLQGSNWWHDQQRQEYREAIRPYNVVAVFHGHTGTDVYRWKDLDVINTGQTEKGFFVVQITDKRMRLGYRFKLDKVVKGPDGKPQRSWDGTWSWRLLLDRRLQATDSPNPRANEHPAAVGAGS